MIKVSQMDVTGDVIIHIPFKQEYDISIIDQLEEIEECKSAEKTFYGIVVKPKHDEDWDNLMAMVIGLSESHFGEIKIQRRS